MLANINTKPLDQWDELDVFQYMKHHIQELRKSLGDDNQPDPAVLNLEAASDQIQEEYYQKLRNDRIAKAQAKREAEIEKESADNYTISFKYNVKGVSK